MAIIIGKRTNLDAPIKVESLNGVTFTTESEAHQFVVRCEQKGQELTLSGTISAKFVRADGNTVQLVGSISDGAAVVTLAQDCYNVQGRFQLAIFNTVGDTKLCIYACVGTVQRAQSGNLIDGGGIIPDVEDLIADIQEAIQSIPPTYDALLASIAETYSATKTYAVGDYVWYDGSLYRCTTAITTAEAWTSGHWTAAVLGDDVSSLKSAFDSLDEELNGVNLIKNGTAIARNTGSASSPNFVFSNGDFKIRRASSAVGNGATVFFPVPENATGKKYICRLNVDGGNSSDNFVYIAGYENAPATYSSGYTELYKSYSSLVNIIDSVPFTISDGINYIGFRISVTTGQSDYVSGNVFICSADEIGKFSEIENEISEKVNKEELQSLNNITPLVIDGGWVIGGMQDSGSESSGTTRARSVFISVNAGETLNISHNSYYWNWFRYNTSGVFQEKSNFSAGWSQIDGALNPTENSLYRIQIRNPVNSQDVVLSDIDVVLSLTSKAVNALLSVDNINDSLYGYEFVTPPVVNICGGIEQNFYYQNMLMGFNTKKAYCIETTAKTTNFNDFARLSPSENTSLQNNGFKVRLYPYNKNSFVSSDTISYNVVPKSTGAGLTKKILLIGDSLTFNPPMSKHLVDDLLASDAMTVSLIGTLGTAPYNREGRSGWSAHDYVSGYEHGDSFTNAFWNPSTNKFDFSYYMSNNGFSGVDYVFINLGTNLGENTVESMTTDLEEMVTSIHAYDPNIRVGVWTPPPRALMGNGFLTDNDNTLLRGKAIINKFKNRTGERIYIVPVTLNVDPYHDFPYETVNVSSRNSSFQMVVATDRTHPADAGYWKMADVIYNYIKYFGSLDAT